MASDTVDRLIELVDASSGLETVDITGGAPELNPHFRRLVVEMRRRNLHVIDRCNLTVLFEPGQADLAAFLCEHQVEIIASLPCYTADNVDKQRGKGVFGKSIEALRLLNELGYGDSDSGRVLNLVYNPGGAFLPPAQASLEARYKDELYDHFGVVFNQLFTLTNMPISRFLHSLVRDGDLERYMELLAQSFNPATVEGLMCRHQVSVDWEGRLYDCDFNQMLELRVPGDRLTLWDVPDLDTLAGWRIATDSHCFGCTAGAGSSCGGSLG